MNSASSSLIDTRSIATQRAAAVEAVQQAPHSPEPRMALFQLCCLLGEWSHAKAQLEIMAMLDPESAVLGAHYGRLIDAEAVRAEVMAGRQMPVALGPPPAWMAMLGEALRLDSVGEFSAAAQLRRVALEEAEAVPGAVDETPFAWIMDADPRFGPVLELVLEGRYRWLPFGSLRELRVEPPKNVRDLVWQPATLTLFNCTERHAYLPVRYPGSENQADDTIRLARLTVWTDHPDGTQRGLGQRLLATDEADFPLLDVRHLLLTSTGGDRAGTGEQAHGTPF